MSSGLTVSQKCVDAYALLNKRDVACLVLKINDKLTAIDLEKSVPTFGDDPEAGWKAFVKELPDDGARYLVTDFPWKETPTVTKSKVVMIKWTPEGTPVRHRLISAASLEAVTSKLTVQKTIQATEQDEVTYDVLKSQIAK